MRKLVVALVASCARGSTYSFTSVREARLRVITCIGLTYILVFIQKSHSVVFCSSALPLSNSGSLCLVCKAQEESRTHFTPRRCWQKGVRQHSARRSTDSTPTFLDSYEDKIVRMYSSFLAFTLNDFT